MILTTISAVTLLFAKGVLNSAQTGLGKGVTPGTFFLAGSGTLFCSLLKRGKNGLWHCVGIASREQRD